MHLVLILLALVIYAEFLGMLYYSGKSASGITWFLCRPFMIEMSLLYGLLTRIALLIIASIILF